MNTSRRRATLEKSSIGDMTPTGTVSVSANAAVP